ncbi:MAG: MauE/DoxX family redox-associated membrane protein [Mycobacteriales bacterium]
MPRFAVPAGAGEWVATAARLLLSGVWLWAGLAKIGDPAAAVRAVRAYRVLPEWLAQGVGYGLPFLELTLAALLLAGLATRVAAAVSAVLLVVFLAGMVSAAARGLQIECGCFGGGGDLAAGQSTAYTGEIVRDAALLLVALALLRWPRSRFALDNAVRVSAESGVDVGRVGPRRTAEARRRLAELAERRRRQGERRLRLTGAVAGVLLVLATGVGIGVQAARAPSGDGPSPQSVTVADGVTVGRSSAWVTLDVYEDPQCPACRQFETGSGGTVAGWVANGTAKVNYHVISFLDSASTTRYSSRAANALYCAADAGVFQRYHELLFANQPAEGSAGLTYDQLVQLGRQAGGTGAAFETCIRNRPYASFVAQISERASRDGVFGTPTVLVDGSPVQPVTLAALRAAVDRAS